MIDPSDGSVDLGGAIVAPSTSRAIFQMTALGRNAKKLFDEDGKLTLQIQFEQELAVALVFKDSRLNEVRLSLGMLPSRNYSDLSSMDLELVKQDHNEFLKRYLGNPPYRFAWGVVESVAGMNNGGNEIIIRYI